MTIATPHPDPRYAEMGVEIVQPDLGSPRAGADNQKIGRPPLTDIMSPLRVHRAWFHELAVAAADNMDTGESAWYLLRSIDAAEVGAFLFHGVDISLKPTDPTGLATPSSGTVLAWGTVRGESAAIVIDRNLNLGSGWNSRTVDLPGIENDQAAGQVTPGTPVDYLIAETFPSGRWTDAVPSQTFSSRRYLPSAERFTSSDRLDVALVMRGSYVTAAAAARVIVGYAKIELYTSPIVIDRDW